MSKMKEILDLLRSLDGVQEVIPMNREILDRLSKIEKRINTSIGVDLKNEGLNECLKREHVICIIKDKRFRPPPEPTLLLVGDNELIVGQEILPGQEEAYRDRDDVMFLSKEFVFFKDKKPKEKEYFLLPPVSFPELDGMDGVKNVVSCSPCTPGDLTLKNCHNLEDDPQVASILVGFNLESET